MLYDLLIQPEHSIVKQVSERFVPGLYCGLEEDDAEELKKRMIYYFLPTYTLNKFDPSAVEGMQPAQFRTIAPISTDLAFAQLCRHTASTCTLAHIRDATFPPVIEVNNHPFIFGKYTLMHNGSVADFSTIRFAILRRIHELQCDIQKKHYKSSVQDSNYIFNILGNTDTEHLATLYFAHLDIIRGSKPGSDSTDELLLALIMTIRELHIIQCQHKVGPFTPGPGSERVGNTLNLCISMSSVASMRTIDTQIDDSFLRLLAADGGDQMIVSRWRDSKRGYPRSLYLSLTAGEKLNRKYHIDGTDFPSHKSGSTDINDPVAKIQSVRELVSGYKCSRHGCHVIVGSEPCTTDVQDWGLFDQNQLLTVEKDHKIRLINLGKFFQPGREHELQRYQFTKVIRNTETRSDVVANVPANSIDLHQFNHHAFEISDLDLNRAD
ncbi:hypothetical protein EV360DRAFT_80760 [Lentinula raphanica]|nr:hypothetical protein EV360DRAFT_80760 [Lentinula raphanica]